MATNVDLPAAMAADWDRRLEPLLAETQEKITEIEKHVEADLRKRTNDVIIRLGMIFAGLVLFGLGGLMYSAWSATRDVYSQVSQLQTSIISAQSTIRESETALREQTTRLAAANQAMASAAREMNETSQQLQQARARLAAAPAQQR